MHAYLLVGQGITNFHTVGGYSLPISNLAQKLKARILNYPLQKIEDVRNLNNLIRLSFDEPTLIVSENIHEAGEEALNAFLKNLEEPQENIYFALTAPSVRKVLPTIASRCQIIRVLSTKYRVLSTEVEDFFNMTAGEKLNYIDKIKDRNEACELVENTVRLLHSKLHENEISEAWPSQAKMVKYSVTAKNIELAIQTLTRLKANGNVNLQLTNMITQMSNLITNNHN